MSNKDYVSDKELTEIIQKKKDEYYNRMGYLPDGIYWDIKTLISPMANMTDEKTHKLEELLKGLGLKIRVCKDSHEHLKVFKLTNRGDR